MLTKISMLSETVTGATAEEITQAVSSGAFNPGAFVDNLMYMGAGMVGIFLVIGAIILSIVLLGKLTDKKKNDNQE